MQRKPSKIRAYHPAAIVFHLQRSNYQCAVWKSTLVAQSDISPPAGNEWEITDNELLPLLITQDSAPKELFELTVCKSKTSKCRNSQCRCVSVGLNCIAAGPCEGDDESCENENKNNQIGGDSESDSESYSESDSECDLNDDNTSDS